MSEYYSPQLVFRCTLAPLIEEFDFLGLTFEKLKPELTLIFH